MTWALDDKVRLSEQDEELLLSGMDPDPILHILDSGKALPSKQVILLEALFVMVYDGDPEDLVLKELEQRKELVQRLSPSIPDYLKQVVLPKLDMRQ